MLRRLSVLGFLLAAVFASECHADFGGRLLATGGVTTIEGSGGGGITNWAMLSGYGTREQAGCSLATARVSTDDYALETLGASCTFANRVELSAGRQEMDLDGLRPVLGLSSDQQLRQTVIGVKARLFGDAVYDRFGQVTLGGAYKWNQDETLINTAGAARQQDFDLYLAGGKLWVDGLFGWITYANLTLRMTRANQTGLLGFGGDLGDTHELHPEFAVAVFPRREVAVGVEYRIKPSNLSFAEEDNWYDAFVAWFPNKHISVVAAWAELGSVGGLADQSGPYISVTGGF